MLERMYDLVLTIHPFKYEIDIQYNGELPPPLLADLREVVRPPGFSLARPQQPQHNPVKIKFPALYAVGDVVYAIQEVINKNGFTHYVSMPYYPTDSQEGVQHTVYAYRFDSEVEARKQREAELEAQKKQEEEREAKTDDYLNSVEEQLREELSDAINYMFDRSEVDLDDDVVYDTIKTGIKSLLKELKTKAELVKYVRD